MLSQSSLHRPITKRRHIYEILREQIRSGVLAPESRLQTTEMLSQSFGVSYLTVHAALRDLVHDGFLVRHQGKGTFVSSGFQEMKRSNTSSIVAVTAHQSDVIASNNSAQVLSILQGCARGVQECGATFSMLSLPSQLEPVDLSRYLQQIQGYEGAVFISGQYEALINKLNEIHFPICVIDSDRSLPASHVAFDRADAVRVSLQHLIAQGHRNIGYFGAVNSHQGVKREAYIKTLEEARLPYHPEWIVDHRSESDTHQLIRDYLSHNRLDAVFIDNYNNANFVATAAKECGLRIPDQLAIMAYGIASATPYESELLSHTAVPYEAMGQQASLILDRIVRGDARPPITKLLPVELRIHHSCNKIS